MDFVDDAVLLVDAYRPATREFMLELFGLADTRSGGLLELMYKSFYFPNEARTTASIEFLVFLLGSFS